MNNKGFTLIELLGVIVILVVILLVAIPSINSTLERRKIKDIELKKQAIVSASEIYASSSHYFDYDGYLKGLCGVSIDDLYYSNLITEEEYSVAKGYVMKDGTIVDDANNCHVIPN